MCTSYDLSRTSELLARARKTNALVNALPSLHFTGATRIGGNPIFVERAKGPYLWDIDGNRYIDFILGYGTVVLGHSNSSVNRAVYRAILKGCNPTLLSGIQVELAERIASLCPNIESLTFFKTGSDATGAAVRLARAMTERRYVLTWGLHGWHDWCSIDADGVLDESKNYTIRFEYNNLTQLESLFSLYSDDIACVIMMPYETEFPHPGFLQKVKNLCEKNDTIFILDEIRSGFRISLGGAQKYFGVNADIVTYGKAMANGHALSVMGGKREFLSEILSLGMTTTYYAVPDAMAASLATIDMLESIDGPARLSKIGKLLMDGIDQAAIAAGVPVKMIGHPSTPMLKFLLSEQIWNGRAEKFFCNAMLKYGMLMSPAHHWYVCTSMSAVDIEQTVESAYKAFSEIKESIHH